MLEFVNNTTKELEQAHKKIKEEISSLYEDSIVDFFEVKSLKKEKLQIKDQINKMKNLNNPDIIA